MIENVENIRPNLSAEPLGELDLLEDRAVEIPVAWPVDRTVARQLAERGVGAARGVGQRGRWRREDRRVEPDLPRPEVAQNAWGPADVRALRVAGGMQVRPTGGEVERRACPGV